MNFDAPLPFSEATDTLRAKELLPTDLGTAELRQLGAGVRDRSIFSARTTKAGILQRFKDRLGELLNGETNMATARARMQDEYDALGYTPEHGFPGDAGRGIPPAEAGDLRDLSSDRRVNLVLETNMRTEANRAYQRSGQGDFELYAWPCYELLRIYPRTTPRGSEEKSPTEGWPQRWEECGGRFYDGRMIARKDDPIWNELGSSARFADALDSDVPPFAFGSGYGWREVSREDAIALGVIAEGEEIEGPAKDRAAGIEAAADFDPAFLRALRDGLDVEIKAGRARLAPNSTPPDFDLAWNTRVFHRDHLGRFAADGGPMGVRDNIARGTRGVRAARRLKADVPHAMNVRQLGRVDFEWGRPGTAKANPQGATHADGYGLSHIEAKHGAKALRQLPIVLARGEVRPHPSDPLKREVRHGSRIAVVKRKDARSSYVVTSFDEVTPEKK